MGLCRIRQRKAVPSTLMGREPFLGIATGASKLLLCSVAVPWEYQKQREVTRDARKRNRCSSP
ncbi:hypothetical protein GCM10023075_03350 [Streptosporangium album]